MRVRKILGTENPADLGTKPLAQADIQRHMATMGCEWREGSNPIALKVQLGVQHEPDPEDIGAVDPALPTLKELETNIAVFDREHEPAGKPATEPAEIRFLPSDSLFLAATV